jgi:hypothetical protein
MTQLLTRAEYQAIAQDLNLPCNAFIDGKFQAARSRKTFTSINPATGKTIAKIAACDARDVDFAVKKAREAFDDGRWSKMHPSERKAVLIRLAKLMKRNSHELAVMESIDSGKPVRDCETIDLPETIHCLIWHAEAIDKIYDQTAPVGDDAMAIVVREPVGVVGCVLPWNFPMLMMAWKIAPSLAAGNTVILKPAEQTSLTALRIAELALEAGLPRGVLNVIPGMSFPAWAPTLVNRWEGIPGSTCFRLPVRLKQAAASCNIRPNRTSRRSYSNVVARIRRDRTRMWWQESGDRARRCRRPGSRCRACGQWRLLEHGRKLFGEFAPDRARSS